jgi:biotin carboxyl carrier protein
MTAGANGASSGRTTSTYRVELDGRSVTVEISEREDGLYARIDDGAEQRIDLSASRPGGELSVVFGGRVVRGLVAPSHESLSVVVRGRAIDARVLDERAARLASAAAGGRPRSSESAIRAPMPGLVVAVPVAAGEQVTKGTTIVILSAMKMQNELTAPADATVKDDLVSPGQTVEQNQVLVRLE